MPMGHYVDAAAILRRRCCYVTPINATAANGDYKESQSGRLGLQKLSTDSFPVATTLRAKASEEVI